MVAGFPGLVQSSTSDCFVAELLVSHACTSVYGLPQEPVGELLGSLVPCVVCAAPDTALHLMEQAVFYDGALW